MCNLNVFTIIYMMQKLKCTVKLLGVNTERHLPNVYLLVLKYVPNTFNHNEAHFCICDMRVRWILEKNCENLQFYLMISFANLHDNFALFFRKLHLSQQKNFLREEKIQISILNQIRNFLHCRGWFRLTDDYQK